MTLKPVFVCNSGESLLTAALAHDGLALLPLWWVKDELASSTLVEVPVDQTISNRPHAELDTFILYQQAKYQIPKIKHCVDFILQHLG
mgnify:FL=1